MHSPVRWIGTLGLAIAYGLSLHGCGPEPARPAVAQAPRAATARAASPCGGSLPAALVVPPGNELAFQFGAVGVQIYTCTATASGATWALKAPEATLYDAAGHVAGMHYAGPTWEAKDGSKVVGTRLAGATPDPTSIPWLLLGAASHAGEGRMEEVTFVQRLHTSGGIAPSGKCDADHLGTLARVDYTATYCFYEGE